MIVQQLFLLSIFLYVAGAVISLVMNKVGRAANYVSAISTFLAACAGIGSAITVLVRGMTFATEFPRFVPFARFTIEVDHLSAFMMLVISLLAAATSLFSLSYDDQLVGKNAGIFGFLNISYILSMVLAVASSNAFYFLVFWEIMTLASYLLVVIKQDEEAINSGFIYFAVAHAAATAIIISFVLLFLHSGSFDFDDFRNAEISPATKHLVFLLSFIGFGIKAGIVPFHFWLPRTYSAAPSTVSALMSAKVAIYGIVRVGVDFLGASVWWWGLTILAIGALSAVLGILYASSEKDLNRQLAYSSTENVGIILMGVGIGMIGAATGQPVLGVLGLLAGLYHLLNHAVFKGLLFLGTGSVIYRIGTKNMEEMGGLAKQMPWTGFAFLTGALAISAIPPLNGFVSEWFLYHSLFMSSTSNILTVKALSPLFAVMLALTGALAAMCFVKAYGVTFVGPSRSDRAREVKEVPVPMLTGMAILVVGCIALGLGAPVIAPYVGTVGSNLLGASSVKVSSGMTVFPAIGSQAVLSTPLIMLLLMGLVMFPLLIVWIQGGMKAGRRIDSMPWACGYSYSSRMASTANSFAQPLRVLFHPVFSLRTTLVGLGNSISSYFKQAVDYIDRMELIWENNIYGLLARRTVQLGKRVQVIQVGNVRVYCMYIIITLVVLLITTVK
ncbi:hydrogenase 4 subunit B [Bacillus methanolicus]|uniref:hydrogenase 4 subunit B n=1 Tax=Bacillus methanolicus TaxID=1471 RepID=UPI00200C4344|nr:hydrogenase 4 subunit B [Bacillus methanolicus]UQD51051.1 hydrogenase 4 subunit B [Bacillus methanolicus]